MDYEKKYKEALQRAKDFENGEVHYAINKGENIMHWIFPELRESEGERVRKAIIDYFDDANKADENPLQSYGIHTDKAIAWLEKQGMSYTKRDVDDAYIEGMAFAKNELEKQGEQNPAWSEEDERLCQCLIEDQEEALDKVRNDKYGHSEIISDLKEMYHERINWLKSLRPQKQWKPSKEQIDALDEVYKTHEANSACRRVLITLLNDLKKLTE